MTFSAFKCDMILTILLSSSRFFLQPYNSGFNCCVCINQALVSFSLSLTFFTSFNHARSLFWQASDFDINAIICFFKMLTRFFTIPLRVNCTTTKST